MGGFALNGTFDSHDAADGVPSVAGTASHAASDGMRLLATEPGLAPVAIAMTTRPDPGDDHDYVFTAPKSAAGKSLPLSGPTILRPDGELVWFTPVPGGAYDFRRQTYQGKPVLTWVQGKLRRGYGEGQGVVYDEHYRQIATVDAAPGLEVDVHEFLITDRDTALVMSYREVPADLSGLPNGRAGGHVLDNVVQEIDIATGKVLLEWHSATSIDPRESYETVPADPALPFDDVHANSIDVDDDGNLLVSARATHAIYKIDRDTGKLLWRMGGRRSDFAMGPGTRTAFQHDVRRLSGHRYSVFDNRTDAPETASAAHQSRGVILHVDERARTVALQREITHPTPVLAVSQGNMQVLPGGQAFIGWGGSVPYYSQIDPNGRVVFEGRYAAPGVDSYRAYRAPWTGRPADPPKLVARPSATGTRVWMSWNGATGVKRWLVLSGRSAGALKRAVVVPDRGFETIAEVPARGPTMEVQALDGDGHVLGTSGPVAVG